MRIKIIDNAGQKYPQVINAETGEKIEDVIRVEYEASAFGRICHMTFIGEVELVADFKEKGVENNTTLP